MRPSTPFVLLLSVLFFALLLAPQSALAGTVDCPKEPKSNVSIASGDVFTGVNCTLTNEGDVDSFVFTATSGETVQLAAALNGSGSSIPDICLALYDPNAVKIFSGCTSSNTWPTSWFSVMADQKLTTAGKYTVDITETATGSVNYAVSLERLYPFPANAQKVSLGQSVDGDISALTDTNAFTFTGYTGSTYQVTATLPSNAASDVCMTVYLSDGTSAGSGCTSFNTWPTKWYSVQIQIAPTESGTIMAFLSANGNDATVPSYSLEVSCLTGTCSSAPPPVTACSLKDTAAYSASTNTLTMNFTIENTAAVTWNAWLTDQNTMTPLFSITQPITDPAVVLTKTASLSPEGKVGVLSTLTTPTGGIICSSWVQIATGKP